MRPDVVFVLPNHNMHLSYNHGVGMLAAIAKDIGREVYVYHIHSDLGNPADEDAIASNIALLNPEIVAVHSSTLEWGFVVKLAKLLKSVLPQALIAAGGPHPTFSEDSVGFEAFDILCKGDGEIFFEQLLTKGAAWFGRERVVLGELARNLDLLPFSDRESFETQRIIDARNGIADFITQRGCPYRCSYCSSERLNSMYEKKFIRRRSVDSVVEEMAGVIKEYSVRMIFFHDDIFTLNPGWVKEFCDRYKTKIGLPWLINTHINCVPDSLLELLADAGCLELKIGIETGDEVLRTKVLNKKISNALIKERFNAIRKWGIRTYAFMMHGLPGESGDSYQKSVEMLAEIQPDTIRSSIYFPLPYTPLARVFYESNQGLNFDSSSMIGDSPSSVIYGKKILADFYIFGWRVNLAMGHSSYKKLIGKYAGEAACAVDDIKKDDSRMSEKMKESGNCHYYFGYECSMLKLFKGFEDPFNGAA